jgi:polyphenol oxidase
LFYGGININNSFKINRSKELVYLTIPAFEETEMVKHCFTTRQGGISQGVCSAIGINYKDLVFSNQVHGAEVRVILEADKGKGITKPSDIKNVDALITNVVGVPLITFYADCVPVFILDPVNKAVGLAHSGWKSTTLKIAVKTIEKMSEIYGTRPVDCLIGIGPSIEMSCFEIKEDTADLFKLNFNNWGEFMKQKDEEHYNADLWLAIKLMLRSIGVLEENISISGLCTCCNEDLFFSHRRDKGNTGSLSAIIELK